MDALNLIAAVQALQPDAKVREQTDQPTLIVPAHALVALARQLRDDPTLRFDLLETHTAVDWLDEDRFELLYLLASVPLGHHLTLSVSIDRDEPVRVSHRNQSVKRLYDEFLGEPLGEVSHRLLHTHYHQREVPM